MKSKKIQVLVGLGGLITSIACAQETRVPSPAPRPAVNDYNGTQPVQSFLTKANKASSLIGMDVRNLQNQKLGDIKDVVLDLPSGRIVYAVLSVGGFLGLGEKYIAVPPSQFRLGADGKELVLDADKARIQSAPGFAKSSWPDLANPEWRTHSTYWGPEGAAVGRPGTVHSGRDTSVVPEANVRTYTGRVVAIDGAAKTITIEGPSGKRTFPLSTPTTTTQRKEAAPRVENYRIGEQVTVRYHAIGGSDVVDGILNSAPLSR